MTEEATTINGILAKLTINERAVLWQYVDEAKADVRRLVLLEVRNVLNNHFSV